MITGNIANKSQFSIKKIQISKKPTSVREYFLYLHIDVCKKKKCSLEKKIVQNSTKSK